jgi:hypothetical protein
MLVALSCAIASDAVGATGWTVYRDQVNQFRLATPTGWIMVPGSRQAASRLAASLKRKGKVRQATLVRSYLADNYQSGENRVVDGIQYAIRTSPILTDFFLVKDHLPKSPKSDPTTLRIIAGAIFDGLAKQSGVRMTTKAPRSVRLHGGDGIAFSGTVPAVGFGGRKTGFAFYVLLGPANTEWQLEFRTDSRQLSADGPLFRQIADSLEFE